MYIYYLNKMSHFFYFEIVYIFYFQFLSESVLGHLFQALDIEYLCQPTKKGNCSFFTGKI